MERLGNVWVSQLMQVQGMSEVPGFFHGSDKSCTTYLYTSRKITWTPRISIVWKEIYCDILWFGWIFPVNISKLTFRWIELVAQIRVYEHTRTHYPWKSFKSGGTSTLQPGMTGDQFPTLQLIGNLGWSFHTNSTFQPSNSTCGRVKTLIISI